ncbi:hypothetical protein [Psychrobacter sp. 72-O-c]|uniref:hypothetical protein n=1 Tax=Psychrobacter sp. 72-O-c TaxID=2774125 RepID=UPI001D1138FF|nr:hypothetical protein [Psychrobacter sp. 72-O-c]
MAILQPTHASILNSNAQVLILPVNSAGILLDPVLLILIIISATFELAVIAV